MTNMYIQQNLAVGLKHSRGSLAGHSGVGGQRRACRHHRFLLGGNGRGGAHAANTIAYMCGVAEELAAGVSAGDGAGVQIDNTPVTSEGGHTQQAVIYLGGIPHAADRKHGRKQLDLVKAIGFAAEVNDITPRLIGLLCRADFQ